MDNFLTNMFGNLYLPTIVCKADGDWPIVYMNQQAGLLLSPTYSVDKLTGLVKEQSALQELLNFTNTNDYAILRQVIESDGHVDDLISEIISFGHEVVSVSISGNIFKGPDDKEYLVLYITNSSTQRKNQHNQQLGDLMKTAFMSADTTLSINNILSVAGQTANVSRVYVFEETSPTMTANTYEWCAAGVEPAIDDLQSLPKADYNFDVIINSGMYITEDVALLPDDDREILSSQGIKALAIITLYDKGKPFGYCGFDDCEKVRAWSPEEISYLKTISLLLSALIIRRNSDRHVQNTVNVLQLLSDNSQDHMYVNDITDYTLLFVNKAMADTLGSTQEELVGKKCYAALRQRTSPCPFCPTDKIIYDPRQDRSDTYVWEFHSELTNKTYFANDNILQWIDGRIAHTETATDISSRIANEERLRYYASTDTMTGTSNREWGANILADKLLQNAGGSLAFFDVDGLKITNDTFGHAVGDDLLKQTVAVVRSHIDADSFLCRWGGDEFLLWLPQEMPEAKNIMQAIQDSMKDYNSRSDKPFKLSFSYGLIPFKGYDNNVTLDTLITAADHLMYENKMGKRGLLQKRRRDDSVCE